MSKVKAMMYKVLQIENNGKVENCISKSSKNKTIFPF